MNISNIKAIICILLCTLSYAQSYRKMDRYHRGIDKPNPIRHEDLWKEEHETVILNCSLKVTKDQHVVWHRKYEKLGVHVLTIESETFISDLRIRPIKEVFKPENDVIDNSVSDGINLYNSNGQEKYTWNLEIRRLKEEDSALYYCVLNSANSYGQIYKLNVLPPLISLNGSEIAIDDFHYSEETPSVVTLMCQFNAVPTGSRNHIKWYFHHYKLNNNLKNFRIVEFQDYARNITTSRLYIDNFKHKEHLGKYRCQYKGLYKMIKLHSHANSRLAISSNKLIDNLNSGANLNYPPAFTFIFFNVLIFILNF